ncbi:MAG TPA: ROK family protein [Cellulomonas sp.]
MRRVVAGIDIGGTTTQVVLVDSELAVVAAGTTATPSSVGGEAMVTAACDLVRRLLETGDRVLTGIGVGVAGVVDRATATVLVASDSFHAWAGYRVGEHLSREFGVPVEIENDVNVFLLAEATTGAAVGGRDVLGVTLGTGVGGALLLDGRLFVGQTGAAGEIGHAPGFGSRGCTCGGRGHLETIASARSLAGCFQERTGRTLSAAEVALAAERGDPQARELFAEVGSALARMIVITTALLDLDTVVIGGGVSNAWELFDPALRRSLEQEPPVRGTAPRVVRAGLGDGAAALGAALLVRGAVPADRG